MARLIDADALCKELKAAAGRLSYCKLSAEEGMDCQCSAVISEIEDAVEMLLSAPTVTGITLRELLETCRDDDVKTTITWYCRRDSEHGWHDVKSYACDVLNGTDTVELLNRTVEWFTIENDRLLVLLKNEEDVL